MSKEQEEIDAFFTSPEFQSLADVNTLGPTNEYLRNRLWKTLLHGITVGRRLQLNEDMEKLKAILKP